MVRFFWSDRSILTASEDYQQRLLHQSSLTLSPHNKTISTKTKLFVFEGNASQKSNCDREYYYETA
jgi:hypothetical protein